MRFSNLVTKLFFLVVFVINTPAFGFAGKPPKISGTADRDGIMVTISGTVDDEFPDNVNLTLQVGGPGGNIPVEIVDGAFSIEIPIPYGEDAVVLKGIDVEGLTDIETVDIPY